MDIRRARGFSYVEIMVALLLLALCALPAASAIKNGLDATRIGSAKARELRCMKNQMETVLAEPYQNLWNAALGPRLATSYSRAADANCVARNVYIARYEYEYGKSPVSLQDPDQPRTALQLEAVLLWVTVSSPDSGFSFTTLVAP